MNNTVTNVYSEAFFELSKETGKLDKHKEDLSFIESVFSTHVELKALLESPNISKSEKKEMFEKIFSALEKETLNLFKVLIDKSRFTIFEDLIRDFKNKYYKEKNIAQGIVYSINKLSDEEISNLEASLEKKLNKKVELKNEIDESLIGGISVLIEGKRIDNSIKFRLDNLRAHLRNEGE